MQSANILIETARQKGREMAAGQPDALVEAFGETAAKGAKLALDAIWPSKKKGGAPRIVVCYAEDGWPSYHGPFVTVQEALKYTRRHKIINFDICPLETLDEKDETDQKR